MIDTSNEDPQYWEKVLSSFDSPIKEPETISIEELNLPIHSFCGITKDTDTQNIDRSGLSETNQELAKMVDPRESFFKGHRIIKIRRGNRKCPDWAANNVKTRKVLLLAFPRLATNTKQRIKAGRWARIIQLYFRSQMTEGQISKEIRMTVFAVRSAIRAIRRTAKNKRPDGTGLRKRLKHALV